MLINNYIYTPFYYKTSIYLSIYACLPAYLPTYDIVLWNVLSFVFQACDFRLLTFVFNVLAFVFRVFDFRLLSFMFCISACM